LGGKEGFQERHQTVVNENPEKTRKEMWGSGGLAGGEAEVGALCPEGGKKGAMAC